MSEEFLFNSIEPFFSKEKQGLKNNTIRKIDLNDSRFQRLIHYNWIGYNQGELKIRIGNKETYEYFIRDIQDISYFEDWIIITWNHEKQ